MIYNRTALAPDSEGCFSISIQRDPRMKTWWRVAYSFVIELHVKDITILEAIKNTLGVGTVRKISKRDMVRYSVESMRDLPKIIAHFDEYELKSAKFSDYLLFKKCLELIQNKEHLTENGLLQIVNIKSSLNWGVSDKITEAFSNIVPVIRPAYIFKGITDPNWVAGFASGDGSFHVRIIQPKTPKSSVSVILTFSIKLVIREKELLQGLIAFFDLHKPNTKYIYFDKDFVKLPQGQPYAAGQVTNIQDITTIIIPFFDKYSIEGAASLKPRFWRF